MEIKKFTFNPFMENTFVAYDETKDCVIIDCGCYTREEEDTLVSFIEEKGLNPVKLLNTHCHIDHVFGNDFIFKKYDLLPEIHEKDLPTLNQGKTAADLYGLNYTESPAPKKYFKGGDKISFGNSHFDVVFVPGHCPGHVAFVSNEDKVVIGGDVLFQMGIGRTDLPGGDTETLYNSIKSEMYSLPDDYTVYCGHGEETTIGFEKSNNPFVHV